jgi:ankyrin repeat protein
LGTQLTVVLPSRVLAAEDSFPLYQRASNNAGQTLETRPQSFAERYAKAFPEKSTWIDTTPTKLDTAQKAFIIESEFRNADPITRGRTEFQLNYNEYLKREAPSYSDDQRSRYVELAGQAWQAAAQNGKPEDFGDSLRNLGQELLGGAKDLVKVGSEGNKSSAAGALELFLKMAPDTSYQDRMSGRFQFKVARNERVPGSDVSPNPYSYHMPAPGKIASWVEKSKSDPQFDKEFTKIAPWAVKGKSLANTQAKDMFTSTPRARHEFEQMEKQLGMKADIASLQQNTEGQTALSLAVDKSLKQLKDTTAKMSGDLADLRKHAEEQKQRNFKQDAKEKEIKDRQDEIDKIDNVVQGPIAVANFVAVFVKDPAANRALRVGALGLAAAGVVTKALSGLINPIAALSSLGDIFGGILSICGGPSVDEQILRELKEVKDLVRDMYANMQAQFGYLHAEIQEMHQALDVQIRHLENRLRMELAVARRLGNESSSGVVDNQLSIRGHADKERFARYEEELIDFRAKTSDFQLPAGETGIEAKDFYKLYRDCAKFCTDGCSKPTLNGHPALGLPEFGSPQFFSVVADSMSPHWHTAEVMRPLSQVCTAAGSPLCAAGESPPNYLCWMIASRSLIEGQEAHPDFYGKIHAKSHREGGRDIYDYSHSQLRDALSQGRKLQAATQALTWKREKGTTSLNRDYLNKLVDAHVQQLTAVEEHIMGRQAEMIPTLRKVVTLSKSMKAGQTDIAIPDQISICKDETEDVTKDKDRPVLKLSDQHKKWLRNLIPTDARILQMLKDGKTEFCIDRAVKWEDVSEGPCSAREVHQERSHALSAASEYRTELECPWNARPVINIKALVRIDSEQVPILNVTLKNSQLIHRGNIYYRGGKGNKRDEYEHAIGWPTMLGIAWDSGTFNSGLEQGTAGPLLAFHDVEKMAQNSDALSHRLEAIINEERNAYVDQLNQDYSKDITARAFKVMDRVDASKQLINRSLDIGFSSLREGSPHVSQAFSKISGMAQLAGEIVENSNSLTTDQSIADFFKQKKQHARALLPAIERSLREHEQDSLEDFASHYASGADRDLMVKIYISNYARDSQLGRMGRNKSIEGMAETLEKKLIDLDGEKAKQEIAAEHLDLEQGITPRSVWGEPQNLPDTVAPCHLADNGNLKIVSEGKSVEPIQLSSVEMNALSSALKRGSKAEDWVGNRIGLNRLRYCWKTISETHPRTFEIFAAYGMSDSDADPMSRAQSEFNFVNESTPDGNVRIFVAGTRRKLPDPKDIRAGDAVNGSAAALSQKLISKLAKQDSPAYDIEAQNSLHQLSSRVGVPFDFDVTRLPGTFRLNDETVVNNRLQSGKEIGELLKVGMLYSGTDVRNVSVVQNTRLNPAIKVTANAVVLMDTEIKNAKPVSPGIVFYDGMFCSKASILRDSQVLCIDFGPLRDLPASASSAALMNEAGKKGMNKVFPNFTNGAASFVGFSNSMRIEYAIGHSDSPQYAALINSAKEMLKRLHHVEIPEISTENRRADNITNAFQPLLEASDQLKEAMISGNCDLLSKAIAQAETQFSDDAKIRRLRLLTRRSD